MVTFQLCKTHGFQPFTVEPAQAKSSKRWERWMAEAQEPMVQSPKKRRGEMLQSYRSHRIYIYILYIWYHENQANVGKCTIYMDVMGFLLKQRTGILQFWVSSWLVVCLKNNGPLQISDVLHLIGDVKKYSGNLTWKMALKSNVLKVPGGFP